MSSQSQSFINRRPVPSYAEQNGHGGAEDIELAQPPRSYPTIGDGLPPPTSYTQYKRQANQHHHHHKRPKHPGIQPAGESGRSGIHPWHFLRISFKSSSRASLICNILWPFVPAALAVRYSIPEYHTLIFALAYVAMVPCANLVGFGGSEMATKLPHVWGVIMEIGTGSSVEIILFIVLLAKGKEVNDYNTEVIQAAILGSILATLLLCLGLCFLVGGIRRTEQTFDNAISEVGSGLLLTAGCLLGVPTIFAQSMKSTGLVRGEELEGKIRSMSHGICVILILSYFVYVYFQVNTHNGIYDAIFNFDEHRDKDKHKDRARPKLTATECLILMPISIAVCAVIAITLVGEIEYVIEARNVSETFMGLILVPLVEKFAEHITAIDEAWDDQMNFALSHVMGATIHTALFNGPLVVIVAWGKGYGMDLDFDPFTLIMVILSIITAGRFLQDEKSTYLEGWLLVMLYFAIGIGAFYYPDSTAEASE